MPVLKSFLYLAPSQVHLLRGLFGPCCQVLLQGLLPSGFCVPQPLLTFLLYLAAFQVLLPREENLVPPSNAASTASKVFLKTALASYH